MTLSEKIENYLSGALSAAEKAAFEQEIAAKPSLRKEVEIHQNLSESLSDSASFDFYKTLQKTDATWKAPKERGRSRSLVIRRIMSIAAVLGLFVVAYLFFMQKPDSQSLMASNFEAYQMILNYRGGSAEEGQALAISKYMKKDYAAAEALFKKIGSENPDNNAYPFYEAICNLAASDTPQRSIELLQTIAATDTHSFQQQARWYLALAYLKVEDTEKAKATLRTIKKNTYKYEAAQKLLEGL